MCSVHARQPRLERDDFASPQETGGRRLGSFEFAAPVLHLAMDNVNFVRAVEAHYAGVTLVPCLLHGDAVPSS